MANLLLQPIWQMESPDLTKRKFVLVDIDPQGTSSASLGIEIWKLNTQLKDVLQSDSPTERKQRFQSAVMKVCAGQVDILPSNILLAVEGTANFWIARTREFTEANVG